MRRTLQLLFTVLVFGASVDAIASPWTLRQGGVVVASGFDFQLAETEFIDKGGERAFPLDGRFTGTTLTIGARYGLTDRLEVEASVPIRLVAYTSDPVILQSRQDQSVDEVRFYQENVVDFSQTGAGVGDLSLAARYQWIGGRFALASEVRVKTPTGYRGPEGTFGPEPTSVAEFMAQAGDLVQPTNVRDDVTLGDGQTDITGSMLAGLAFSTGTFFRAGAGYKLRLGGAGDQVVGDLRFGQSIGDKFLFFGAGTISYAIQAGRVIGISASAVDPDVPATDYIDGTNVLLIPRRLAYDAIDVSGGFIWRMAEAVELNASYQRTVWGRFIAATNTVNFSIAWRSSLVDR